MEPYTYASGDVWGAESRPAPQRSVTDPTPRPPSRLQLRARRAKRDPLWRTRSREEQRRLLDLDERDAGGPR